MIIPFGIRYSDSCHNMNLETQASNEKEFFCPHHFLTVLKKFHTFKNKAVTGETRYSKNSINFRFHSEKKDLVEVENFK